MWFKAMFVKRIDGRDYAFRMYWDAAAPGALYWMVVEVTPKLETVPEEVVGKIHHTLEKHVGFPNVPAPVYEEKTRIVRFKIRLTRTPKGVRPRKASDWMKVLERGIQAEL